MVDHLIADIERLRHDGHAVVRSARVLLRAVADARLDNLTLLFEHRRQRDALQAAVSEARETSVCSRAQRQGEPSASRR